MRPNFAVRFGLGFLVLGLAVFGAAVATRVRLERSEGLRVSLAAAVRDELGLSLQPAAFELNLIPPRVQLASPAVELPAGAELHVDRATLDLALMPLLRGRADVTEIVASGRTTLVMSNGTLSGDTVLRLERSRDGGWRGELSGELAAGGSFEAEGSVAPGGRLRAAVAFQRVEISPLSSLLLPEAEPRSELAGIFAGTVDVDLHRGPGEAGPTKLVLRLESPRARIRIRDISVDGPVRIEVRTDVSGSAHEGSFELDAGAARVEYAGGLQQASGSGASLRGRVDWSGGKLSLEDLRISVKAFRGQVGVPSGSQRESDER